MAFLVFAGKAILAFNVVIIAALAWRIWCMEREKSR